MDRPPPVVAPSSSLPAGGARAVLEASARSTGDAALVLVLETSGSTYVRAGALALFGRDGTQAGWLSGGCLEPDIARLALDASARDRLGWMEIDTRSDEDLLSGSAVGCRGHLRLALLPLARLGDWGSLVEAWRDGAGALRIALQADGRLAMSVGTRSSAHTLPADALPWADAPACWNVSIAPPPSVLVLGAGPETPMLLPLLRALGAVATLVERRPRWAGAGALADVALAQTPTQALATMARAHDAALVMHHHFELDREALDALAGSAIGFVGLLGPVRRRDDLFRVLPPAARESLLPRLHSPVGLHLGGSGPEAIALSIAAQLQRHLHGADA
ncbi:MAG TPA: XdhC family protein [Lysobacter sp.]